MKATEDLGTKASGDGYNKTQLNVEEDMERNVFHRDRLAHFFRWAHIMRAMRQGYRVVDLGCGTGNLAIMLYANRFNCHYVGVDIRGRALEGVAQYFAGKKFRADFLAADLCLDGWQDPVLQQLNPEVDASLPSVHYGTYPDVITSFEFIEHIPGEMVEPFFMRVKMLMGTDTRFYLSTPCFDGVRKAENHIKEWYYLELRTMLERHFEIEDVWGTFMSQKDFEICISEDTPSNNTVRGMWARLKSYYGSESLAILFAPLFANCARNAIWKLKLKEVA